MHICGCSLFPICIVSEMHVLCPGPVADGCKGVAGNCSYEGLIDRGGRAVKEGEGREGKGRGV